MSSIKRLFNVAKGKAKLLGDEMFGEDGLIASEVNDLLKGTSDEAADAPPPAPPDAHKDPSESDLQRKLALLEDAVQSGLISQEEADAKRKTLQAEANAPATPKKRRL